MPGPDSPPASSDARATPPGAATPGVAVIACAVLESEIEHLMAGMPHIRAYRKLEQGLHNEPDRLRQTLAGQITELEATAGVDAIVLGYGLCSRGIDGLGGRRCPLAVVRAHDCITLLLGSRERYNRYVAEHPGTYWYSPGWNRHHLPPGPDRYQRLRHQYVQRYGEDNADYLMETEQHWFRTYRRATYVHLSIGATDEDRRYTRRCADWLNWTYDEQAGDPSLLTDLLAGRWQHPDILVVPPGQRIAVTADQRIIDAAPQVDPQDPNRDG